MATEITTLPHNVNYSIWQGDTWNPGTMTAYNGAAESGNEIDFTGYSGKLEIRTTLSGDVVKTLSTPSSGISLSSLGVITLSMTAADTNAIPAGEYKYDLQITSPGGAVKTYTYGAINVTTDVTANS